MSYKEGKFYVIQAKDSKGKWFFVENLNSGNDHRERWKIIARKAGRSPGTYSDIDPLGVFDSDHSIRVTDSPYDLKMFSIDTDMKLIVSHMRHIRTSCGQHGLDANSLRVVLLESKSTVFVPEDQSEDQIELRKFALEKLSDAEKELLKVSHWEVYHKLADRTMLEDDDDS